jgi:hypothetical protein
MTLKEKTAELLHLLGDLFVRTFRGLLRLLVGATGWIVGWVRDPRTRSALDSLRRRMVSLWQGLGRRLLRVGLVGGGALLLVWSAGHLLFVRVAPGETAVRVSEWGGGGVTSADFGPGLHLGLPGAHAWYRLPSGTQWLSWRAAGPQDLGEMLGVRTQDGNEVFVAAAVPYRIREGEAHRIVAESNRHSYPSLVRAKTEALLLAELGRLSSEDFVDTDRRRDVLAQALLRLNESLAEVHVEAEAVLIEDLRFPAPYEKKLQENQLEKLRGRMLAASQAVSEEQLVISRRKLEIESELQARRVELERGILEVRLVGEDELEAGKRATASFVAEQRALADREYEALSLAGLELVLEAEALEARLEAEVYASPGGELYLAQQAAEATRIQSVTLDANDPRVPNVLDPDEMTRLFLGE